MVQLRKLGRFALPALAAVGLVAGAAGIGLATHYRGEAAAQRTAADYFEKRYFEEREPGVVRIRPGKTYLLSEGKPSECTMIGFYNNGEKLSPIYGGGC